MSAVIIELNDLELRAARDATIVARSPAAAIVDGNAIEVGEKAIEQAQLRPREFHNRFWYQLDQSQLRRPTRAARHHADLAFRHLEHVHEAAGKPDRVVFAVPGGFSKDQLALLLGITEACQMRAVALVDAAVASAAANVGPGRYQHVDIQLHRAVVTEIEIDEFVGRRHVEVIDSAGFDKLNDRLVAFIADQFLAQSRFDPLHQANTEQLLYNEMPTWLALLATQRDIRVHIDFRGSHFEARIARDDLIAIAEPTYRQIIERLSPETDWLVGNHLASLPGFVERHESCVVLTETAVFEGSAELASNAAPAEAGLALITSLPASAAPTITAQPRRSGARASSGLVPSHIVSNGRAFALTAEGIHLNTDGSVSTAPGSRSAAHARLTDTGAALTAENGAHIRVNGLAADRSTFGAGDEITIEGASPVYLPITLASPDAS